MNCIDIREQLNAYIDGELTPAETTAAASHLEGCESCRRELAAYRDVANLLQRHGPAEPPARLLPDLRIQIEKEALARRRRAFRPTGRMALAASFLLAVLGGVYLNLIHIQPDGVSVNRAMRSSVEQAAKTEMNKRTYAEASKAAEPANAGKNEVAGAVAPSQPAEPKPETDETDNIATTESDAKEENVAASADAPAQPSAKKFVVESAVADDGTGIAASPVAPPSPAAAPEPRRISRSAGTMDMGAFDNHRMGSSGGGSAGPVASPISTGSAGRRGESVAGYAFVAPPMPSAMRMMMESLEEEGANLLLSGDMLSLADKDASPAKPAALALKAEKSAPRVSMTTTASTGWSAAPGGLAAEMAVGSGPVPPMAESKEKAKTADMNKTKKSKEIVVATADEETSAKKDVAEKSKSGAPGGAATKGKADKRHAVRVKAESPIAARLSAIDAVRAWGAANDAGVVVTVGANSLELRNVTNAQAGEILRSVLRGVGPATNSMSVPAALQSGILNSPADEADAIEVRFVKP